MTRIPLRSTVLCIDLRHDAQRYWFILSGLRQPFPYQSAVLDRTPAEIARAQIEVAHAGLPTMRSAGRHRDSGPLASGPGEVRCDGVRLEEVNDVGMQQDDSVLSRSTAKL